MSGIPYIESKVFPKFGTWLTYCYVYNQLICIVMHDQM